MIKQLRENSNEPFPAVKNNQINAWAILIVLITD